MKNPARLNRYQNPKLVRGLLAVLGVVSAAVLLVSLDKNIDSERPSAKHHSWTYHRSASGTASVETAEQMPELIGGLRSIQEHIRYPRVAKKAGIEGRVIVEFVVDERGRVRDPRVVSGIGGGCDEEALRAVEQSRFVPGKNNGHPVRVKMSIPVTFKLGHSQRFRESAPIGLENPDARIRIDANGDINVNGESVLMDDLFDFLKKLRRSEDFSVSIQHESTPQAMRTLEAVREALRGPLGATTLHYRIESL